MNSKKLKRISCFLIIFLILLPAKSSIFAKTETVKPTSNFYVNDYAGVLTEETKNYIIKTNAELQQKTGAQIVVVTIKSLENTSIEEYATTLFRNFGIGDAQKNNGVLLLCSTGDRKFRIEVGYGLEGTLTDGKTGRIQDTYIIPYLKNNNYNDGIKNGFNAILNEVTNEYQITISGKENAVKEDSLNINGSIPQVIIYTIVMIISQIIFCIKNKKGRIKFSIVYAVIYIIMCSIGKYISIEITVFILITFVIAIFTNENIWRRFLRRRRLLRRRWFFRRRRLFWRRRKHKKFLK